MARFLSVCRVGVIAEGRALAVDADGLRVAVFNDGGVYRALLDRCPHAGASLAAGWVSDGEAVCPFHRWRFRLTDGRCAGSGGRNAHSFRCEVRDGEVWVEV